MNQTSLLDSARNAWALSPFGLGFDIDHLTESVLLDKDRGAERALEHFAATGPLPHRWFSVGDSRSDYLMADHLHAAGFEAVHVDVRPSDGMLARPYEVITIGELIHDEAGAAFLAQQRGLLGI